MAARLCIFEDGKFLEFFPLSLAQPVFDLRVGAGPLRDRWGDAAPSLICRDDLVDVVRLGAPDAVVNEPPATDTLFINARWLCWAGERDALLARLSENSIALVGGDVVAARVAREPAAAVAHYLRSQVSAAAVEDACAKLAARVAAASTSGDDRDAGAISPELARLIETHRLRRVEMNEARLLSFPWQLIEHNSACIADDFARLAARGNARDAKVHPSAHLVEPKRIHLGARCEIRAGVVIDASGGPVLVGEGAVVLPNATVLGPVAIGAGSIVKAGARILSGTSIGRVCKVGGEVDETIIADYSNKQHDGFLGHSYLGSWVNIGAASNNSDLKNNYGAVRMWNAGRVRDTGRQFLGLVMGDHTKTGINAVFNTGTVVGFNCNLYSSEMPDAFVPSFSWGHGTALVPYQLDKATQVAEAAMKRRGLAFTAAHRRLFERVHEISARSGRNT